MGDKVLNNNSTVSDGGLKMAVDESVAVGCGKCAQQTIKAAWDVIAPTEEEESKQELMTTEFETPLSPIGIGILNEDDAIHTLITANITPLPAYISKVIQL